MADETEMDRRRRKVEAMLWAWGERVKLGPAVPNAGYPSTSPTYRMMREAGPAAGRRGGACDGWRQRQRRVGQGMDQRLELEQAQTCFGRETKAAVFEEYTRPEIDADRMGPPTGMLTAIVAMMPPYQQDIIEQRFIRDVRGMKDIAAVLGIDRNRVATLYQQAIDQIYRILFEITPQTRRSIIPDTMAPA